MKQWLLATGLLLAYGLTATALSQTLPVELFTQSDRLSAMKLATDGQSIAMLVRQDREDSFVLLNLKDRSNQKIFSTGRKVFDFHWVSPTDLIYFVNIPNSDVVKPFHNLAVYAADINERPVTTLIDLTNSRNVVPELLSTVKGSDRPILLAMYPQHDEGLVRAPYARLKTAPQTYLSRGDVRGPYISRQESVPLSSAQLLLDSRDQLRCAVGYDADGRLALIWRPTGDAPWQSIELTGFRDFSIRPFGFGANDQSVLFTGVRTDESVSALFHIDLSSRSVAKLYQHPFSDIAEVIIDVVTGAVAGIGVDEARRVYHWLDPESRTAKVYQQLARAFQRQNVRITSWTDDASRALVFVNSDTNPGEYYLFDTAKAKAELLFAARASLDVNAMRAREAFAMQARDGTTLHGFVTSPRGAAPHPLVVLPHDGVTGERDLWDFDARAQLLANRGFAVLQVNFRGSGGYGRAFEFAGHRQWGARMQDDITDATRWAIERGIATADRICIFGVGYGAYAAMMGAVREPSLYRCVAGYSGVYDLQSLVTTNEFFKFYLREERFAAAVFGDRSSELRKVSPAHNADRVQAPVLLLSSAAELRFPVSQTQGMRNALQRAGKSVETLVLKGGGSGNIEREDRARTEAYQRLLAFLQSHLGPGVAPTQ